MPTDKPQTTASLLRLIASPSPKTQRSDLTHLDKQFLDALAQIKRMQDFLCERGLFQDYMDWMESHG